jgi:adenosylmethionine-8-amino-7-oxononanoate aminotransferase
MSRTTFDEVDDLFFDFDTSRAKRRTRSTEDDVAALREEVHALEQQLVSEVQRTQKMIAVIVEALVGSGADVTPSSSYLRGDRRLCATCYDAE